MCVTIYLWFINNLYLHFWLISETQAFVDKLFEAINNKNYVPPPDQPSSLIKVEKEEPKKDEVMKG